MGKILNPGQLIDVVEYLEESNKQMDGTTNRELMSYRMEEYYDNVTSMTIGELYLHNGQWKFNPVGNGVNKDLAGQCAIYGVNIE